MSEAIHAAGARGLAAFGYEPPRAAPPTTASLGCTEPSAEEARAAATALAYTPTVIADTATCAFETGFDYKGGGDIRAIKTGPGTASATDCCDQCARTSGCGAFTYDEASEQCYLKRKIAAKSKAQSTAMLSGTLRSH